MFGDFVERAEHWQLVTQPHQLLDGDVDDVNAGLHDTGDLLGYLDSQRSCLPVGVGLHTEQFSNRFVVAIQRGERSKFDLVSRGDAQRCRDILDNLGWNRIERREVSQELKAFEQHQQCQATLRSA